MMTCAVLVVSVTSRQQSDGRAGSLRIAESVENQFRRRRPGLDEVERSIKHRFQ